MKRSECAHYHATPYTSQQPTQAGNPTTGKSFVVIDYRIVSATRNPHLAPYTVYRANNSGCCNRNVTVSHHFFVVTEDHSTAHEIGQKMMAKNGWVKGQV